MRPILATIIVKDLYNDDIFLNIWIYFVFMYNISYTSTTESLKHRDIDTILLCIPSKLKSLKFSKD